jgi:hypothetical protein
MTTATTTKRRTAKGGKTPAPTVRYLKLLIRPGEDGPGLLSITVGGVRSVYWLKPIDSQDGGRAFELRKFRSGTVYTVRLGPGSLKSCDCPAATHRHSCKHSDAVAKLVKLGRV